MKDASVVSRKTLTSIALAVEADAAKGNVLDVIAAREPILAAHITERMQSISGKLALAGAPPQAVQAFFADIATVVATAVRTVWAASDELWEGVDLAMLARPRLGRRVRGAGRRVAEAPPESGKTESAE
jgi:hypothetical protein